MKLRTTFQGVAIATLLILSSHFAQATVILAYDSVLPGSGGSTSQLTRIDSVTDASFVSASNQFSATSATVAGGFVNATQSNVQGPNGDQNDLNFRFGSNPELVLANGAAGVAQSLADGHYVEFVYTAAQAQILDEIAFRHQANSQNAANHSARDIGVFVDVAGGGFNLFDAVAELPNGLNGVQTFSDSVTVNSGDTVTIRLVGADRTLLTQNLQAATRIGDVQISAIAIPEPASFTFAVLAFFGILSVRRRRSYSY